MRILGLDYGEKTVGAAVSDGLGLTAQPVKTITRERSTKLRKTYQELEELIREYEVGRIVVGKPLRLDGTSGERVERTEEFAAELERRTGLPVEFVDERLTTREADRILEETGVAHSARKEYIDKMAAAIILQTYLDMHSA